MCESKQKKIQQLLYSKQVVACLLVSSVYSVYGPVLAINGHRRLSHFLLSVFPVQQTDNVYMKISLKKKPEKDEIKENNV